MIVETSAIVAMMLEEPDAPGLIEKVHSAPCKTSVVNAFEAVLSVGRIIQDHPLAKKLVPEFLDEVGIEMVGVDSGIYADVVDAYLNYGKGTGHPAKLNFGDCFSYAMAKRAGVPLLYKGNDFSKTDLA